MGVLLTSSAGLNRMSPFSLGCSGMLQALPKVIGSAGCPPPFHLWVSWPGRVRLHPGWALGLLSCFVAGSHLGVATVAILVGLACVCSRPFTWAYFGGHFDREWLGSHFGEYLSLCKSGLVISGGQSFYCWWPCLCSCVATAIASRYRATSVKCMRLTALHPRWP